MVMAEPSLRPDLDAVSAHLAHITARWDELGEPVMLELVFLSSEDKATVKDVRRFSPDRISEAAAHVVGMNQHRVNAYAVVNPVRADAPFKSGTRASSEHIAASFFHWADADDGQAADNIRNFVGPPFTFCVLTGTHPTRRPHVYWELEDPIRNFAAWEQTQRAIAESLKTDRSVVDPPRIMRLAGTINWPKPKKQAKGYVAELTTLHLTDNPSVSSERMARAFAGAQPKQASASGSTQWQGDGTERVPTSELVRRVHAGEGWHDAVIRIVGRLVAKGLSDDDIHAFTDSFTQPGFSPDDTRQEVQAAIDGCRRKGWDERSGSSQWEPDPEPNPFREITPEEEEDIPALEFKAWERKDLSQIPKPQFVYGDFYARGFTSLTLAAPKVGKSMLALAEAVDMASGRGFLSGVKREPQRVFYYNAEDDQNTIDARVAALLEAYGIDQDEIVGRLFAVSGINETAFYLIAGSVEPVVNERLFVGFRKFAQINAIDVAIFDPLQDLSSAPETNEVFRLLGQRLRLLGSVCRMAIGLIHHTRKVAAGMTPSIDDGRGGSALRGTARFNRVLVGMSEDEAAKAGVDSHHRYFRIGDVEGTLIPPSSQRNRWFQKDSVHIPNDDWVGAIRPWEWPDAMDGVSPEDARAVQLAVQALKNDPPRENSQSKAWVGHVVAETLGLDVDLSQKHDKARVLAMVKAWIRSDVLMVEEIHDGRTGRDVKVILAGNNNPTTREVFE